MSQDVAAPNDSPSPRVLLADLEARQDELLRLLDDLEQRTKQAIAQLAPATAAKKPPETKAA